MDLYKREIGQKKTKVLLSRICITCLFLLLISENNRLSAQKPDKSVLFPGTIEIDSITIKAKIPPVDPVVRPYTEPVSLLPVISNP